MIEITFLGQLVATLSGFVAFALLLLAIAAAAFVLATASTGLAALPPPGGSRDRSRWELRVRLSFWLGLLAALGAFLGVMATLSMGTTLVTAVFGLAFAALVRSSFSAFFLLSSRSLLSLGARRVRRAKAALAARESKALAAAKEKARKLEGKDLEEEVADADAALERLRDALATLVDTRAALGQKLALNGKPGAAAKLDPDVQRLRDELSQRIDLGKRVLIAAEEAAFRLACAMPVKKLVRRRPVDLGGLDPRASGDPRARIDAAIGSIDGYLAAIREARAELDAIGQRRPTLPPPGEEETRPGAEAVDPLERASRDIDAIESAYRALRERAELARLGLSAVAGMAEVATAAGEVSARAGSFGLDDREKALLLDDLARVERATALEVPFGEEDVRVLARAVDRGASALDEDDRASLADLVTAFGAIGVSGSRAS